MISLLLLLAVPAQGETVALKAGRVIVGDGRELQNAVIVIEGGILRAVGADVAIPDGARILDLSRKVVMPGLIDANAVTGVAGPRNEDGSEVTPHVRILDSLEPDGRELKRARQSGITTLFVGPGNRNVIGGLGAVVRTSGKTRQEMTRLEDAALKAAMGSGPATGNYPPRGTAATFYARRPTTRMGVVWEFRKAFHDARKSAGPGNTVLVRALEKKLTVRIAAGRATDIEEALRLAEEFGLSIVLEEAQEAWVLAPILAERKVPVLLRPLAAPSGAPGFGEALEGKLNTFAVLREAGVLTALLPLPDGEGESLLAAAALAVKHGARRDDALRAVTLGPAEILGVADRVGSVAAGKEADLLVFSGDPLDVRSRLETVLIGGKVVHSAPEEKENR